MPYLYGYHTYETSDYNKPCKQYNACNRLLQPVKPQNQIPRVIIQAAIVQNEEQNKESNQ
jgi:hypothetical protein